MKGILIRQAFVLLARQKDARGSWDSQCTLKLGHIGNYTSLALFHIEDVKVFVVTNIVLRNNLLSAEDVGGVYF